MHNDTNLNADLKTIVKSLRAQHLVVRTVDLNHGPAASHWPWVATVTDLGATRTLSCALRNGALITCVAMG